MDCECAICSNNKPFDMPKEIIDAAVKEELVLFCGAGVSTEKKTVLPHSFYSNIRDELDITDDLSFSDLMQKYTDIPNGRRNLLKKIRERFKYIDSFPELHRQATTFHRELSEIYQIKTIITTNWDTYFEDYCGAVPITIPEDISLFDESSRHVLKIHGSINNLSSIVATKLDYDACYERLQNGVIGAQLKSILATKTVVFIGFSFGDEDFSQILKYLKNEMGNVFPHIYIVTIDAELEKRLNYNNCTTIVTAGEHFIHSLKNALKENGSIVNTDVEEDISINLSIMRELHEKISKININSFPSVIYTLAYQDGAIHAWERYLKMNNTGEYNRPGYIGGLAGQYQIIAQKCHAIKNYWDESYYEGYINGLVLIAACAQSSDAVEKFPFIYLPNSKLDLNDLDTYHAELKRISSGKGQYHIMAKKIVKERCGEGMVVHHPPY